MEEGEGRADAIPPEVDGAERRAERLEERSGVATEVRDRTRTLGQVCVLAPSVTFNFADGRASDTLRPAFPTRDLRALIEDELLPAYTRCLYLEGEPALHSDKAAALAAAMQAALAEQLRTYDAFRRFTTADASAA